MAGSKSVGLLCGERKNILNINLWKKFTKDTGIEIEYRDFVTIIDLSSRKIKEHVLENIEGFKLPEGLGYMVMTRYKDKRKYIDYNLTKELGKTVYSSKLLLSGYNARVQWFTRGCTRVKFINEYKFIPDRDFKLGKSKKLKEGKLYNSYNAKDFRLKEIRLKLDNLLYGFNTN